MPVETDVNWEVEVIPEEVAEAPEPPPAPVPVEELVLVEPSPNPKPRRARAPKAGTKAGKRKPVTRRKTKPPAEATQE